MFLLPRGALALMPLAGADRASLALSCAQFRPWGGGFRLDVTDGRRLAVVRADLGVCPFTAEALPDPAGGAVLLDARALKAAAAAMPRRGSLGLALGDAVALLVSGEQSVRLVPAEARYPDVDAVLPARPAPFSIRVNPALFAGLLQAAAAVVGEGVQGPAVELLFWAADRPLGVAGRSEAGVFFDALLMPLPKEGP
jgi:hypothetical protein